MFHFLHRDRVTAAQIADRIGPAPMMAHRVCVSCGIPMPHLPHERCTACDIKAIHRETEHRETFR